MTRSNPGLVGRRLAAEVAGGTTAGPGGTSRRAAVTPTCSVSFPSAAQPSAMNAGKHDVFLLPLSLVRAQLIRSNCPRRPARGDHLRAGWGRILGELAGRAGRRVTCRRLSVSVWMDCGRRDDRDGRRQYRLACRRHLAQVAAHEPSAIAHGQEAAASRSRTGTLRMPIGFRTALIMTPASRQRLGVSWRWHTHRMNAMEVLQHLAEVIDGIGGASYRPARP